MYKYGYGVKQDYAEALKWLGISAEEGYPMGQFNYGAMYVNATGVARDLAVAAKWYELAAQGGNVSAQFGLADMYIAGQGVEQNYQRAGKLYLAAARQGHSESQYNIGEMYAAGYGVPQSFVLGYMWTEISAQTSDAFHRGRARPQPGRHGAANDGGADQRGPDAGGTMPRFAICALHSLVPRSLAAPYSQSR